MDYTFAELVLQQQSWDTRNSAIIIILMMELRLEHQDVNIPQFPISKKDLFQVRKRLLYNIQNF